RSRRGLRVRSRRARALPPRSRARRLQQAASGFGRSCVFSPRPPTASRPSPTASRSSSCTWRRSVTTTSPTVHACAAGCPPPVRAALAGGALDGALARVAATGALARSRDAALDYAARARSFLNGDTHREELEALTYAIVDREN